MNLVDEYLPSDGSPPKGFMDVDLTTPDEYRPHEGPTDPPRFDTDLRPEQVGQSVTATTSRAFEGDRAGIADIETSLRSVQLETRGVTAPSPQRLFWHQNTVYKNSVAAKLRSIGRTGEAGILERCHTEYTVAQCKGCSKVQKFPNRCDVFYCAECQPRLSNERKKAVQWWVNEIAQPKHVVLTVKNYPSLTKAHVREFRNWFSNLRRRKWAKNWKGGFYSMEVTNEGNGWHLHLHALVDARWIDAIELSVQWASATHGAGKIVKVKDARAKDYLAEITKYVVKGVQLAAFSAPDIATFIDAFDGVRCFGVFGSLYGKRTEFAEWFKAVRDSKPLCACGCCEAWYFSEAEWLERDFVPDPKTASIPPPLPELTPSMF